jgi:hypothetical protein
VRREIGAQVCDEIDHWLKGVLMGASRVGKFDWIYLDSRATSLACSPNRSTIGVEFAIRSIQVLVFFVLRRIHCSIISEGRNGGLFVGDASVLALDHDIRGHYTIMVPGLD